MANPNFQSSFLPFSNLPPRQANGHTIPRLNSTGYGSGGGTQGVIDRHNPHHYGTHEYDGQMAMSSWETGPFHPHMTRVPGMAHSRSTSENLQATSFGTTDHDNLYSRRGSVPSDAYAFQPTTQSLLAPGSHMGLPTRPSQLAPLMTSPIPGGNMPGPYSDSPPHTQWYTPQSSPHPHPHLQLNPGFPADSLFSPYANQEHLAVPDTSYGGNDGVLDHPPRSNSRMRRSQRRDTRDPTRRVHSVGSSVDFYPVASGSGARVDDSEFAVSPGAESDPYSSFPDTPADTNGGLSREFDEAALRSKRQKERQKLKKREDRKAEAERLKRVKELLGLGRGTRTETLEAVIGFLGGEVPVRTNEPTKALPGRERNERATQVAAGRREVTQLYAVIVKCMGYTTGLEPKRELLLEEVANEIGRRKTGIHPPVPQGGGGPGGYHWMAQ